MDDGVRAHIRALIAPVLERMAEEYRIFAESDPDEKDAKRFAARHAAGRAALAHIDLLLRLARWAEAKGSSDETDSETQSLLRDAQAALAELAEDDFEQEEPHRP